MFESIRKHSKVVMILLFVLIIPSFIFVGVNQNYFQEKSPVVAKVNGQEITQADWDNAHRMESDRLRSQSPDMDAKLLDTPQARYATLERLVRDRVLNVAVQKMHMFASDAALATALQQIPQIAALKKPDGSLDVAAYRALVGAQGLTPEGFEANMRRDLSLSQVLGGVLNTAFVTDAETKMAVDALYQQREIQVARFPSKDFASKVVVSDADVEAFYKDNSALFRQPEQASIEYVVLDNAAVRASIKLNEDDLRTYYKENLSRFMDKEQRRASHILINASKSASAEDRAQAKKKAEALLAEVKAQPGQFADVAKKNSQDTGSAAQGGDLNFFSRGDMVKPFEDAAFSMKPGDISDVIESDYGYHIIKLTDVKTPRTPSFEELRPKIENELQQQQAQRKYAEAAEAFSNMVFEQSDSLKPVADKLGLKIQSADHVGRTPAVGVTGPLANATFLEALFSNDSLKNQRNTEAIEVAPSTMAAGRIVKYQEARVLPLEEVKAKAHDLLVAQKSAELARKDGEAKLAEWKVNAAAASLQAPVVVSRQNAQQQPVALLNAVMHAKVDASTAAWVGVDLGADGYAVARVNKIVPRAEDSAELRLRQKQEFERIAGYAEATAYYELLKERYKAQILAPRPAAQLGS
ncbi:MAG: SurA N-terminal domain-containing protein [Comamonas sp.]